MNSKDYFLACFGARFWQKLKETIVPGEDMPPAKEVFLQTLYQKMKDRTYQPSLPREYVIFNKHNYVTRIVPAFTYEDYVVFFYCIKALEKYLCKRRTPGTFGGWRLNSGLKQAEQENIEDMDLICGFNDYGSDASYNPLAWRKHWQDFQNRAYEYAKIDDFNFCIKFDIANFYDCISFNVLEHKIRLAVDSSTSLSDEIELLFYFLRHWNRRFEGYRSKSVGLPQDEVQDCSRILANFYLQDYDCFVSKLCLAHKSYYLRYADDQLIYSPNRDIALKIMFESSKYLHQIGLNINSSKVKEFSEYTQFEEYWAFDIFELLSDKDLKDKDSINRSLKLYFNRKKDNFRWVSVLNRILMTDFNLILPDLKYKLFLELMNKDFLTNCNYRYLYKIFTKCTAEQKKELFNSLDSLIESVSYNSFHYNILKFYKKTRPGYDFLNIENKIKELKLGGEELIVTSQGTGIPQI